MNDLYRVLTELIIPEFGNTVYMMFYSTIFSTLLGFFVAIILYISDYRGLHPNKILHQILEVIVNIIRPFPFIILAVALIPITRVLIGTSIGRTAAIVPLTMITTPFTAKLIESALREVDEELVQAAKSLGGNNFQIVCLMIKEAMPAIVLGITLSVITILNCTAMAGAIGAGGLGNVALTYGYQGFNEKIMYSVVIILVIMVQILQKIGDLCYRKLK